MTGFCGMDVRREAFDETGRLSFSQSNFHFELYCAIPWTDSNIDPPVACAFLKLGNRAGTRCLRPGRDTASGSNANKIGPFQGGVLAKVHLSVLSGAQCDARENPGEENVWRRA
ncbi:hypothetical protein [Burkholderia stagnalis]